MNNFYNRKQNNFLGKNNTGFTLIETLVAISILVVAITAPLSLASQSLFVSTYAKDQITASYLAQEAIEVIRQKRDQNMMQILKSQPTASPKSRTFWIDGIIPTSENKGDMIVDARSLSIDNSCPDIDDTCSRLKISGNVYNHMVGDNSRFSRIVTIEKIAGNDNEISIKATVKWKTGKFIPRTFTIKENLYNWLPNYIH